MVCRRSTEAAVRDVDSALKWNQYCHEKPWRSLTKCGKKMEPLTEAQVPRTHTSLEKYHYVLKNLVCLLRLKAAEMFGPTCMTSYCYISFSLTPVILAI